MSDPPKTHRKHFFPLESDPEIFTALIHRLGFSSTFGFHDVLSIDDPELLAFIARPALALVLLFPTTEKYEKQIEEEDKSVEDYAKCGEQEDVLWYKQTINNACGLYGILHAVSNGAARDLIVPNSHLDNLVKKCKPLLPEARAEALENDTNLEESHKVFAMQGQSEVPANAWDEVNFHYVCFVKSSKNDHLYQLDGARKGPKDLGGPMDPNDDMLSPAGRNVIKEFILREKGENANFSLMVLAPL